MNATDQVVELNNLYMISKKFVDTGLGERSLLPRALRTKSYQTATIACEVFSFSQNTCAGISLSVRWYLKSMLWPFLK